MPRNKHPDRGVNYQRARYKPGLGVCPCGPCQRAWYDRTACGDDPRFGEAFGACEYLNRERVFAEAWEAENFQHTRRNNRGLSLAQHLMATTREAKPGEPSISDGLSFLKRWRVAFVLAPRDRIIIATIIQWLGTNVGWCWLGAVLDRCGYRLVRKDEETARRVA